MLEGGTYREVTADGGKVLLLADFLEEHLQLVLRRVVDSCG